MNVSLTPELERLVTEKVESGAYTSASEVVCQALWLLKERDDLQQARWEELRQDIAVGIEQADRGETRLFDAEELKRRIRERLAKEGQPERLSS